MRTLRVDLGILVLGAVILSTATVPADILMFQDDFNTFALGTNWQATAWQGATGAPDSLTGGVSYGGSTDLRITTTSSSTDWKGLETINSFRIDDKLQVTLDARVTGANFSVYDSVSPMEVALVGSSGEWVKEFYTYTAWRNNYLDSDGHTGTLGNWPSGMTPGELRRWTFALDYTGLTASVFDKDNTLRWSARYPSPTLLDLGSTVQVLLRHNESALATVYVDFVKLTASVPEPSSLALGVLGAMALGSCVKWRKRRPSRAISPPELAVPR